MNPTISRTSAIVTFLIATAITSTAAHGGIQIVSQSADVDRGAKTATFRLDFSEAPDFFTVDDLGRPAHSFQYEVNAGWSGRRSDSPLGRLDTVIRGDEIRAAGDLRVRSADFTNPDPDPLSGGWGPVLGSVPFTLGDDHALTFTTPLALLGDDDGVFAYRVFATNFGQGDQFINGFVVPLPAGALPGGLGMVGLAIVHTWTRRRMMAEVR